MLHVSLCRQSFNHRPLVGLLQALNTPLTVWDSACLPGCLPADAGSLPQNAQQGGFACSLAGRASTGHRKWPAASASTWPTSLPHLRHLHSADDQDVKGGTSRGGLTQYLPKSLLPYAHLMRLDKPAGTWVLLWPGFWCVAHLLVPCAMPNSSRDAGP
jgi:hypothetical protein